MGRNQAVKIIDLLSEFKRLMYDGRVACQALVIAVNLSILFSPGFEICVAL